MSDLTDRLAGKFIVFDGPDGAGKGTQIRMLADRLSADGAKIVLAKDPGGTTIGDRIRHVLLNYDLREMDLRCETLLFMASRAQLVGEVIAPALRAGKTVLCDRFISATCAYQGAAGCEIERIIELGRHAVGQTWPDLTIILDLPVKEGFRRTGRKPASRRRTKHGDQNALFQDAATDAMEARPVSFHERVRKLFLQLPELYPRPVNIVDASGLPETVHTRVMETLERVRL